MTRFLRPESAFFLLLWLALLVQFRGNGFRDPGSLWHPVVGEIILTDGLPHTDPFTFTFEGRPWVSQWWGAEVALALAHRAAGLDGMLLGFATVVAGFWTWVFARMRAGGMSVALAAVMTAAALTPGLYHYFVRPHIATIVLLGWTTAAVIDFDRGRDRGWRLAGLVPVFVLWTNLHGGVLGGLLTLGLAVAGWLAGWTLGAGGPVRSWRTAALPVGVLAASLLTPVVNPYGLDMPRAWLSILGSEVIPRVVPEHMPLDLRSPPGRAIAGLGLGYVVLLAGVGWRVRVAWLIPLAWLALAAHSIRHGPLFAAAAGVAIADFWSHTLWHRLLQRSGGSLVTDPGAVGRPGWRAAVLPAAAVLAALGLQAGGVAVPVVGRGWARFDPDAIPVDLADDVRSYQTAAGPGARMFNDLNLGGFLIYHAPGLKIYADDRFELAGDSWLMQYGELMHGEGGQRRIEALADEAGFDHALVTAGDPDPTPMEAYLTAARHPSGGPRWREVRRGRRAVLFARVPGP